MAVRNSMNNGVVVLGGGLSGLMAARALRQRGIEGLVLEQCPTPGGLTRTINVGDYCFDYTGHFLHLAHFASPGAIPFAGLDDRDWVRVRRRSLCYLGGQMVPAPAQYHLGLFPDSIRDACIRSYEERVASACAAPETFREFLVTGFGAKLADEFLIPQNEKTFGIALDRLHIDAVKRFFPPPDDARVRAGIRGEYSDAGYNSSFWYPASGGIERLIGGLAAGTPRVLTGREVTRIDLRRRRVFTSRGETFQFGRLLTSIPLKRLCEVCDHPSLARHAARLSHSTTICYNLGMLGPVADALKEAHWVYVPDRDIPFYRVGVYSNISPGLTAADHHSLYVEVGFHGSQVRSGDVEGRLRRRVLAALSRLGWIREADIRCTVSHAISCAYVHHLPDREAVTGQVFEVLANHGVTPIGRYGRWDYTSMEDSMLSALQAVDELAP